MGPSFLVVSLLTSRAYAYTLALPILLSVTRSLFPFFPSLELCVARKGMSGWVGGWVGELEIELSAVVGGRYVLVSRRSWIVRRKDEKNVAHLLGGREEEEDLGGVWPICWGAGGGSGAGGGGEQQSRFVCLSAQGRFSRSRCDVTPVSSSDSGLGGCLLSIRSP